MATQNQQVPAKTAEVKAKKEKKPNPKKEARKAARKAARPRILAFLEENAAQLGTLADDIRSFVGGGARAASSGISGTVAELRDAIVKAGKAGLSEMVIFKRFSIGRPEMNKRIRSFLKVSDKTQRTWVKFFEPTTEGGDGLYKVVGTGEKMPEGWDGYVPSEKVDL